MPSNLTETIVGAAIACALATSSSASVTISADTTQNESCNAGVCTPTGKNANINVGDLQGMLANSDVTVKTGAGSTAIGVTSPLTWASTHRLTLEADQSIHIRAPIMVEGTSGITLLTISSSGTGGVGGDYTFNTETSGSITFWDTNSSLIINGRKYKLESSLPGLIKDASISPTSSSNSSSPTYPAFALANDYDASADGVYAASPIQIPFRRILEGLGHSIANLQIKSPSRIDAGLFARTTPSSIIRDVGLTNANISGGHDEGALVALNEGSIANCFATGMVLQGKHSAGGLVGGNSGTITNSTAAVTVSASYAGGLVGFTSGPMDRKSITYSSATGDVTGDVAGGLVGESGNDTIYYSHASGFVQGMKAAGGLVGSAGNGIGYSYATGNVIGGDRAQVGGLAGVTGGAGWSFATGNVTGGRSSRVGGLVGEAEGAVDSYARGDVKGGAASYVGGLAGYISGNGTSGSYSTGRVTGGSIRGGYVGFTGWSAGDDVNYWDVETSSTTTGFGECSDGEDERCAEEIVGLTTSQFKSGLPEGYLPNVWAEQSGINDGYPYLLANPPQ